MEGSLLGAVRATRLLLSAYSAWHGGEAAPRNHRLNLETERGGRGGGQRMEEKEKRSGAKTGQQKDGTEVKKCAWKRRWTVSGGVQ